MNVAELKVGEESIISIASDDGGFRCVAKLKECIVKTIDGKEVITLILENDEQN